MIRGMPRRLIFAPITQRDVRVHPIKARKQVGVFITRLAKSTNPKGLATHIKRETGLSVSCEPLRTKFDTYSSFCVRLPPHDGRLLLWSVLSLNEFCNYLGKIVSIIEEKDTTNVGITGDFNAAINTPFESELIAMCANTGLVISDYEICGRASNTYTYTYVGDAHNSTSWLDHFICSHSENSRITDLYIY